MASKSDEIIMVLLTPDY